MSEQVAELVDKQTQLAAASPAVLPPPPIVETTITITPAPTASVTAPPTAPCPNAPAAPSPPAAGGEGGGGITALGWEGITVQKSGPHYRLVIAALTEFALFNR